MSDERVGPNIDGGCYCGRGGSWGHEAGCPEAVPSDIDGPAGEAAVWRTAREPQYGGWTYTDDLAVRNAWLASDRPVEEFVRTTTAEAKVVEALLPEPAYWIVTWPGKSQGVHAAYGDIEEAKHAAKNIANYSTKKTETTIVPLYTAPASDLWKDRYESLLADAQRMEASIGARDE